MNPPIIVQIKCENGHEQEIKLQNVNRDFAEGFAGLLDGTSPAYVYPPDDNSAIGKCGICRAKIVAAVL